MLCALDLNGKMRGEANSEHSVVENPPRWDHFSFSIASNALGSTFEAQWVFGISNPATSFDLNPQPRHALELANQLMNDAKFSVALDVLLHTIEHVQGAATRSTEDPADILGA